MAAEKEDQSEECLLCWLSLLDPLSPYILITLDDTIVKYYYIFVIKSFCDKEAEKIFSRHFSGKLPQSIQHAARKKLILLDAAIDLNDLLKPPGNRLEALKGNRKGQYSIRINDQWRICFIWKDGDAHEVEITDYH